MTKKVVFIMSAGHSGSSLLSLILGSHPACFSVGELKGLHNRYKKGLYLDCVNRNSTFWQQTFGDQGLKSLAQSLAATRVHSLIPLKFETWVREMISHTDPIACPYSFMFSKVDAIAIVDSSKAVSWIHKRLQSAEFTKKRVDAYLIHLVRDGRAVFNSFLRKYPGRDPSELANHWVRRHQERMAFYQNFSKDKKIEVRYEKLAMYPAKTVQDICQFLSIEFAPDILEYWKYDHHDISGNDGTYSLIDRYRRRFQTEIGGNQNHSGYHDDIGLSIKLDLRWQRELDPEKADIFERIAGDVNRPYEWNSADVTTRKD